MTEIHEVIDLVGKWLWLPFVTVVTSAIGFHLKADRENRKDFYKAIKEVNNKVNTEHSYVEENYVRQDTFEIIREDIGEVKEELKRLGRDIRSGGT